MSERGERVDTSLTKEPNTPSWRICRTRQLSSPEPESVTLSENQESQPYRTFPYGDLFFAWWGVPCGSAAAFTDLNCVAARSASMRQYSPRIPRNSFS